MTSRTTDVHCRCCGKYMYSYYMNDKDPEHYCKKKDCQRQAVVDKLKEVPALGSKL